MYIVVIAWAYVVLLMAIAEAMSPTGTLLGAFFTLLLYGALPIWILTFLLGTPARRRALRRAEAERAPPTSSTQPDGCRQPPADAPVAPVREEP